MSPAKKPSAEDMPFAAEIVKALRAEFGADMINAAFRNGLAGGSDFYARENGFEIGTKFAVDPEKTVKLSDCAIGPQFAPPKEKTNGRY